MSSRYAPLSNIRLLAHILHPRVLISVVAPYSQLIPSTSYNGAHQVISHQRGRRSERTQDSSKNGHVKLNYLHMQCSPILPIFCAHTRSAQLYSSAARPHHRIHPKLLLPCTRPPHPFSHTVHSLHVAKPSQYSRDPHYSPAPFQFQLFYAHLHSQLYSFVILPPNFSNTSSQEHSLSFSQQFSYPMPLLRTTPLVHHQRTK